MRKKAEPLKAVMESIYITALAIVEVEKFKAFALQQAERQHSSCS